MLDTSRMPAVAGMFYPAEAGELRNMVNRFLDEAPEEQDQPPPKAIIAPHAGYMYSGPIAASAYVRLKKIQHLIQRVVLLGPSHRLPFRGLAATSVDYYVSPLGKVKLDREAIEHVLTLPQVSLLDQAHAREHSLEVHLPFLQVALDDFSLIPLVVGEASPEEVGGVLDKLWGGEETLIVISSDLSHYHDYDTARRLDEQTSRAIENLQPSAIHHDQACGRNPVNGLLSVARRLGLKASTLDLRNSGDTAGSRDQVVGYGAYAFN